MVSAIFSIAKIIDKAAKIFLTPFSVISTRQVIKDKNLQKSDTNLSIWIIDWRILFVYDFYRFYW